MLRIVKKFFTVVVMVVVVLSSLSSFEGISNSDSPYLKSHANRKIEWRRWGEKAFEEAKKSGKPIFLSIGYSSCHWCHMLFELSFENSEIARMLNDMYIPILVDREEMPHVDEKYQRVFRKMTGKRGGWPLNIILSPDGIPIYSATYIPPEDGYGVIGMKRLLPLCSKTAECPGYRLDISEKRENSTDSILDSGTILEAIEKIYDREYGGFGTKPKLPRVAILSLLEDIYLTAKDGKALSMLTSTLDIMEKSGLYDQIDGAFFRYCGDRAWIMPHFEKMLYTNAGLISLYSRLSSLLGREDYNETARRTAMQMQRRFRTPEGLYFSSSDAGGSESEGEYFLMKREESLKALISNGFDRIEGEKILDYLDIGEDGNYDTEYANPRVVGIERPERLDSALKILSSLRQKRKYPNIDRKIVTSWNAMMISALFDMADFSGFDISYAESSYSALKSLMYRKGTLYHSSIYPKRPTEKALLEDYAWFAKAAFRGYLSTLERRYLEDAILFTEEAIERFYDGNGSWRLSDGFAKVEDIGEDTLYESPATVEAELLFRLSTATGDTKLYDIAYKTTKRYASLPMSSTLSKAGLMHAYLLAKTDIYRLSAPYPTLESFIEAWSSPLPPNLVPILSDANTTRLSLCSRKSCFTSLPGNTDIRKMVKSVENILYGSIKDFR